MSEMNHRRVAYYGRNDLSVGTFRDRCIERLSGAEASPILTVNDAIEAHQCKLMVDNIPELFSGELSIEVEESATRLFANACKFISQLLSNTGVDEVFELVELQYAEQFWDLVEASGATTKIKPDNLRRLIDHHPGCIGPILRRKRLVTNFDEVIKQSLLYHGAIAAELIISRLTTDSGHYGRLYLPPSLDNSEIDSIMLSYINSESANPNYLQALRDWPSKSSGIYRPSSEVRVLAKRKYKIAVERLFANGTSLRYSTGASIDMNQVACKGISVDGYNLTHIFSGQWLGKYTDPATIMNNMQFVFDYIDTSGLMYVPARKHEDSTLLASLGTHVRGEYLTPIGFQMRSGLIHSETITYADFLESNGTSIENALEWAYGEYFPSEYGITGFTLSLPAKGSSWLNKCEAMGPEIERAIKRYAVYSKRGEIDDDFFPYETIASFASLMALEKKKYAIAGPRFDQLSYPIFSDQSMLAYLHKSDESEPNFFDAMIRRRVTRQDYPDYLQPTIDELINSELIIEESGSRRLLPTPRSVCIKSVWDHDALPLRHLTKEDISVVESLINDDALCYSDQLFAPVEAAYLDYMFNDASFPNSLALRNRYNHAHGAIKDPQASIIRNDYYRLLSILICITLKINEELANKTGRGNVEDFDDWPLYDESILQTSRELWEKDHSRKETGSNNTIPSP